LAARSLASDGSGRCFRAPPPRWRDGRPGLAARSSKPVFRSAARFPRISAQAAGKTRSVSAQGATSLLLPLNQIYRSPPHSSARVTETQLAFRQTCHSFRCAEQRAQSLAPVLILARLHSEARASECNRMTKCRHFDQFAPMLWHQLASALFSALHWEVALAVSLVWLCRGSRARHLGWMVAQTQASFPHPMLTCWLPYFPYLERRQKPAAWALGVERFGANSRRPWCAGQLALPPPPPPPPQAGNQSRVCPTRQAGQRGKLERVQCRLCGRVGRFTLCPLAGALACNGAD